MTTRDIDDILGKCKVIDDILGKCKALVHPHANQIIATYYRCTRKAVRDGFCTQHHKVVYGGGRHRGPDRRA